MSFQVEFRVKISPYAYEFYRKINRKQLLFLVASLCKRMSETRYRSYANEPRFYTNSSGRRQVVRERPNPKDREIKFALPPEILNFTKKVENQGHSRSWIVEEALYYGIQNNLLGHQK